MSYAESSLGNDNKSLVRLSVAKLAFIFFISCVMTACSICSVILLDEESEDAFTLLDFEEFDDVSAGGVKAPVLEVDSSEA